MHEFKHGELKSGRGGKGGKVKSRRQAIAIALSEAGASKYSSERKNRRKLTRARRKEARGETYQQEREESLTWAHEDGEKAAAPWADATQPSVPFAARRLPAVARDTAAAERPRWSFTVGPRAARFAGARA
jgi:hypothetical protein